MRLRSLFFALPLATVAIAAAQAPPEPTTGTMHLVCNVGSFRLVNGTGTVDITFKGTILVTELKGTVVPSGNVKVEWDKPNKKAYFGNGHLQIKGAFRNIQWFGSDLNATWVGNGRALLFGEYDKNLDTGFFWYDDPAHKIPWSNGGWTADLPGKTVPMLKPTIRGGPQKKSGG